MEQESFGDFIVYNEDKNYTFIHINLRDDDSFYKSIFDYFFNEDRMLTYIENNKSLSFEPSRKNYTILFRELKRYIDNENATISISALDKVIRSVLKNEGMLIKKDGKEFVRKDKIGKMGEYIFSILLRDYFQFDCILPKVHLQTDYNMSIYGIDTVFYSGKNDMLLFGESKFSSNLKNGITLLKNPLWIMKNK